MTRSKVLIAGGGIAGLEALLALHETAREHVHVEMLAPDPGFRFRPLSVAQPFNHAQARQLDLAEICLRFGATFTRDALVGVEREVALTQAGRRVPFDYLLVAVGARAGVTLPGAVPFWDVEDQGAFGEILADLESRRLRSLAFVVPSGVVWSLGLYELALLAADRLRGLGMRDVPIHLVTPEPAPLAIFGRRASEMVAGLLERGGVTLTTGALPVEWRDGVLRLQGDRSVPCGRAVSLPIGSVPPIAGLPQDEDGFLRVDKLGAVIGADGVYAAGDATAYPVKQGGIATQAADCAAATIARAAGANVAPEPFRSVLRGALLTPWGPRFMRRGEGPEGEVSKSPLWLPPSKVAGRYLAPFLAAEAGYDADSHALVDRNPGSADPGEPTPERDDVVALALDAAEADARQHDYRRALRWLEAVEDLELCLPEGYETKRVAWQALAREQA